MDDAVMKIGPALPPPAAMPIPSAMDAQPGQPFEDFLGGGAAPGRAVAFAQFGMFGRDEQAQGPSQVLPPGRHAVDACKAFIPIESLDRPIDAPQALSPAPAPSTVDPGQRPAPILATPETRPHVPTASTASVDPGLPSLFSEPASTDEDTASPVATARRANRSQAPQADVSLIMSEKDGAVELVAAGPQLDPQTGAMLRRLARAILARSGLDLAKFHLNGAPIAPDSTIMIGGSHGTRTR